MLQVVHMCSCSSVRLRVCVGKTQEASAAVGHGAAAAAGDMHEMTRFGVRGGDPGSVGQSSNSWTWIVVCSVRCVHKHPFHTARARGYSLRSRGARPGRRIAYAGRAHFSVRSTDYTNLVPAPGGKITDPESCSGGEESAARGVRWSACCKRAACRRRRTTRIHHSSHGRRRSSAHPCELRRTHHPAR